MIDTIWNYLEQQLLHNQFSQAALLAGAGAFAWGYLRGIPMGIWRRIHRWLNYSVTIEQENTLHRYMDLWMQSNVPTKLRKVEATLIDDTVSLSHENDYIYLWRQGRRITVSKIKQKLEAASSSYDMFSRTYQLSGLFAKKQIHKLLEEAIEQGKRYEALKATRKTKPDIFVSDEWGQWWRSKGTGKTFDKLYLKDKQIILNDLELFKSREQIYADLGVAYKRGYLFHGPPGNGKSTIAYAIGDYMKYDIYSLDLSGLTAANFAKLIKNIPDYSVLVIEDIDSFYHGREPLKENKLSFSTFINALSGVAQKNNIITVITTNELPHIDKALLRDGRCDVTMALEYPDQEVVEQFLTDIYQKPIEVPNYVPTAFAKIQGVVLKNLDNAEEAIKQLFEVPTKKESKKSAISISGDKQIGLIFTTKPSNNETTRVSFPE